MNAVHASLNALSQFWIHTEIIFRLPCGLEYVLNSASHHRLHHEYPGNCNYAGLLIIWDRLFGTFVAEGELEQIALEHGHRNYGLAEQVESFNPLVVNLRGFQRVLQTPKRGAAFFSRRAKHQWLYFSIADLLRPIPFEAQQVACSSSARTNCVAAKPRTKYNGGDGGAEESRKAYWARMLLASVGLLAALVVRKEMSRTMNSQTWAGTVVDTWGVAESLGPAVLGTMWAFCIACLTG